MRRTLITFLCAGALLLSTSFVRSTEVEALPTCTGVITDVTWSGGSCATPGTSGELCIYWTGTIPALEIYGAGFTVTSSNPEDVCCGVHCFDITLDSGLTNTLTVFMKGAGGSCHEVPLGFACFPNCTSSAECF